MNSVVTAIAEIDRGGRYDAARRWPLSGHVCAAPRRGSRPGRAEPRSPSPDCHEVAWSGALQAPLGVAADLPFAHTIYGKPAFRRYRKGGQPMESVPPIASIEDGESEPLRADPRPASPG